MPYFAAAAAMSGAADSSHAVGATTMRYLPDFATGGEMVHRLLKDEARAAQKIDHVHKESEMNSWRAGAIVFVLAYATAAAAADTATQRFAQQAAADGIAEVDLADLALERAGSNDVKTLANHIKQDHQQANDKLKSIASSKGVDVPAQTDDKHRREKERLAKLQGNEFDRAYVKAMVKEHEQDIKAFEKQAKNGKDPEFKAFASEALPKLREHLDHAKQIEKQLQAKK